MAYMNDLQIICRNHCITDEKGQILEAYKNKNYADLDPTGKKIIKSACFDWNATNPNNRIVPVNFLKTIINLL